MNFEELMDYMEQRIADKKAGRSLYNSTTLRKQEALFGHQDEIVCKRCGKEMTNNAYANVCRICLEKEYQ